MNALIIGAGGFAGFHLAQHLSDCGDRVLGVGRGATAGVAQIAWDVRQSLPADARRRIVEFQPEAIYHLAAISIPADCGSEQPTAEALAVNVAGTDRVLGLAASLSPAPRVLIASSSYVYAPVRTESLRVSENALVVPASAYGRTKQAAEELALAAARNGLPVVIARAFNHTGPRQSDRMMLPEWCRQFAAGDNPVLVRCRDAWLDLTDVRDVVRAYRLLIERGEPGTAYNVGSGVAVRSGDLLAQLASLADPQRRILETSPGRRQGPIADIARLTAATRWRPQIDLSRTVAETWAWWQAAKG